ncbi:MAG: 1-acyl-sn-glycerol-3-phosphate acyltransferase, partial [Candidatus Binatia bacterium]
MIDRLGKTIASYGIWTLIILTSPLFFLIALLIWLVTGPFDRRLRVLHLYSCAWASFYTYVFPYWFVSVRNRERLRNDQAYVVVSNHQSLLDILVLFRLYRHFKWVSKAEIFRLPFIGW